MLGKPSNQEVVLNTEDDENVDFSHSNADLILALPAPQFSSFDSREIEFTAEDYKTALRLLVGAALEGSDELRYRLKMWLVAVQKREQESGTTYLGVEATGSSPLLYTTFGFLIKTANYVSRGASTAGRVSRRTTSFANRLTKPVRHSRVLRPVRRRYHNLVARWDNLVSPFEETGRSEARSSRLLVRQEVTDEMVEEFLVYVVERSKMRELIVETSTAVGGDALDEVRGRSASVDSSLDELIDNILRRQKRETPPPSSIS
jgi:hypothetical protein